VLDESIASSNAGGSARVPCPPGTMSTSRSFGGCLNVCVGTMDSAKREPAGFRAPVRFSGALDTGSRVDAIMDKLIGYESETSLRMSSGPKMSMTSKLGKTMMP
jgi:hypothetical protein